jgi:hypothetical protein
MVWLNSAIPDACSSKWMLLSGTWHVNYNVTRESVPSNMRHQSNASANVSPLIFCRYALLAVEASRGLLQHTNPKHMELLSKFLL